jgi:hypothetical protein
MNSPCQPSPKRSPPRDKSKASDLRPEDKRNLEIAFLLGIGKQHFTTDDYVERFNLTEKYSRLNLHHRCVSQQVSQWNRRVQDDYQHLVWDSASDPVFEYIIEKGGQIPDTIVKKVDPPEPSRFPSVPNDRTTFRNPKPDYMGSDSEEEHYDPPPSPPRPAAKPVAKTKKAPSSSARAHPPSRHTMSEPPGSRASDLSFSLEAIGVSFVQINKLREFRAIDPDNPQNTPPGSQCWVTPNQQVEVDGESKTVTKFTILLHAGADRLKSDGLPKWAILDTMA